MNHQNPVKKYTLIILLSSLLIVAIPFAASCQAFHYKFNYLTVDEGLSHTDANDIAQDKSGYIWVATYFGLDRFDGYTIKKYYNSNTPLNNAFKNRLRCVYPDQDGNIWLGTEAGLQYFNSQTEKYVDLTDQNGVSPYIEKVYKPTGNYLFGLNGGRLLYFRLTGKKLIQQTLILPENIQFSDFAPAENGDLYLSSNKGIYKLVGSKTFAKVSIIGLANLEISSIGFDKQQNLVLLSGNSAFLTRNYLPKNQSGQKIFRVTKTFISKDQHALKDMVQDYKGNYWINNDQAILRLDTSLNLIQVINKNSSLHSLNTNSLTKLMIDRSACLWVCTFGGGVNYCDLNEKLFYTLQHNPEVSNSLSGNHIRSILEQDNNLWIGTTANGLNDYNLTTHIFTTYNSTSGIKIKNDAVQALVFDDDKNLWIGSGSGIDILKSGGHELIKPNGYTQFPQYAIENLVKDYFGNIWFGNHVNKFGVIYKDQLNTYHVRYYGEGYFIYADKNRPQLLISSTHGLKRIIINKQGEIVQRFNYQASSKNQNSLSSSYTYPISKKDDSTYWIGTIGGGVNRLVIRKDNSYSIRSFTSSYGVFNDVESMEIDKTGNIWMGGNGLECLNPETGKLIRYDKNDGLQGNSFKVGASYKGSGGRLYFGGINGLNYFYPEQIKANNIPARPILTDILINNQKPTYHKADPVENTISQAIGFSEKLILNHLQNNFVLFFSSMHFANPLKCRYRYQLAGFDKKWNYTDGRNPSAAYNNLDYGTYEFILEATNNDGIWSTGSARLTIEIIPPWWQSFIAKIIYILLLISVLGGIYIYQARWYRLKREIELQALGEKKREEIHLQKEEFYQQQLMFFTNVSHEFRTPLTLILGPLESLISQNKNSALDYSYQLMFRNAKRLINLIGELMNFKKVADSVVRLRVQPAILSRFFSDLGWDFQNLAVNKNIAFTLEDKTLNADSPPLAELFDVQVLEKILFNLLNNAFKYTNAGGQISFELFYDFSQFKPSFKNSYTLKNTNFSAKKYIYFRIADTGIGISGESISHIFDRFYRISKSHLGSGVGLAIVKSLTLLHKGNIYVFSERYKGTEIIISIPRGEENYSSQEKVSPGTELDTQLEVIDNSISMPLIDLNYAGSKSGSKLKKHILLVEDNKELRFYLKRVLEDHYYIYEADDGNSALEIAVEHVPDLIISDVMMPGMNGIELCKKVKENFETSHIPFIILSAKDALDTKLEGMESGADFYFAKPLSIELLLVTIHNVFEQSEKIKQRFAKNYLSEATELVHSEKDKEFLQSLLIIIETYIEDPDLDVDFLCKQLYTSRTKLYQKIKSISDQSVAEFIRTIRLKKSIQLMTHEDLPMNLIADKVGLQSSSNFSRAFKKEYGKSPLQFMQALKKSQVT